jgi:pimeloyl-[acyl-carrier protein] methyl ester esterase
MTDGLQPLHPWSGEGASVRTVGLRSGPVRVHTLGDGPALVFIHGWGMGAAAFASQAPLALQGFQLVAVDLPGFAGTLPAASAITMEQLAGLVCDLTDTLGLVTPVLVGWSMGASIAWIAASQAGDRFAGVVSLDMSPRPMEGDGWGLGLIGGYSHGDSQRTVAAILHDWPAVCAAFLPRILQRPDPEASGMLAALAAATDPQTAAGTWASLAGSDLRDTFARLEVPLLAIHGASSALYMPQTATALQALNPRCEVLLLEGVGHAPQIEAPGLLNTALATFAQAAVGTAHHNRQPISEPTRIST